MTKDYSKTDSFTGFVSQMKSSTLYKNCKQQRLAKPGIRAVNG